MLLTLPDDTVVEIDDTVLSVETELGSVTAHRHKAKKRTIERWKNPEGYAAVRASYADEIQELENAIWQVKYSNLLDDAFGASLDKIGRIVGEARQGAIDAAYRVRIKVRIRINQSFGTALDLIGICNLLELDAVYTNYGSGACRVDIRVLPESDAVRQQVAGLLGEAVAAGVRVHVSIPTSLTPFRFSSVTGTVGRAKLQSVTGTVADVGQLTHGYNT